MTGTEILGVIAGAFGVGMGASPLLQAARAHRRRSAADISALFLCILFAGGLAWLAYGLAMANPPLIIGNAIGVASSGTAILITVRLRAHRHPVAAGVDAPPVAPAVVAVD